MPDNVVYLYAGLTVVIGLTGFYIVSLILRFRRAAAKRHMIQTLRE
jgi:hypothetical protein